MFYHLGKNSKKPLRGLATTLSPPSLFVRGLNGIALHHLHWLQIAITKTPERILFNNEISNLKQGFSDFYISQKISMMNTFAISFASYFPSQAYTLLTLLTLWLLQVFKPFTEISLPLKDQRLTGLAITYIGLFRII